MIAVPREARQMIAPLFAGIDDSMVIAYLQGYMGEGYVASPGMPQAALIVSGEYSFWGGDALSADAAELVSGLFSVCEGASVGIFADDRPEWETTLLSCHANNPAPVPRFGIVQRDYDFDVDMLRGFTLALPSGYELVSFDAALYRQAMANDWSKEFCETFASADDYLAKGFGAAALREGRLVSGASTMTVYDGGYELQVATHPDYGQQGLGLVCAAALILESVKRGVRPHWDAANLISKKMALKLGFEYKGEYTTIHMHR